MPTPEELLTLLAIELPTIFIGWLVVWLVVVMVDDARLCVLITLRRLGLVAEPRQGEGATKGMRRRSPSLPETACPANGLRMAGGSGMIRRGFKARWGDA